MKFRDYVISDYIYALFSLLCGMFPMLYIIIILKYDLKWAFYDTVRESIANFGPILTLFFSVLSCAFCIYPLKLLHLFLTKKTIFNDSSRKNAPASAKERAID